MQSSSFLAISSKNRPEVQQEIDLTKDLQGNVPRGGSKDRVRNAGSRPAQGRKTAIPALRVSHGNIIACTHRMMLQMANQYREDLNVCPTKATYNALA